MVNMVDAVCTAVMAVAVYGLSVGVMIASMLRPGGGVLEAPRWLDSLDSLGLSPRAASCEATAPRSGCSTASAAA